jgi:serine/threonine-protein kinase
MAASDVFGIVGTTQAGNFRVERVVAEGGFGVVYQAQHEGFRAPVALKCLKVPEELTEEQRELFLEKFREEAELMFRLSAAIPEVCRPLHIDVLRLSDGRFVPFLALEWLEGEPLDAVITRRRNQGQAPLGIHKLIKMMRPIAVALSRAHHFPTPHGAVAIIHRDLKPENLFLANVGGAETMKILDFGIATARRAASLAAGRLTGNPATDDDGASFTPAYGAPEQWSPKSFGPAGPWTDVWGLALTLVEALSGRHAIDGDSYEMRRICLDEKRRPTPRSLGADVPVEVERVFERALAVDPRHRPKDIETFWSGLERAMRLPTTLGTRDLRRDPSMFPERVQPASRSSEVARSAAQSSLVASDPGRDDGLGGAPDSDEREVDLFSPAASTQGSDLEVPLDAAFPSPPKGHVVPVGTGSGPVAAAIAKVELKQLPVALAVDDADDEPLPAILMSAGPVRPADARVEGAELDLHARPPGATDFAPVTMAVQGAARKKAHPPSVPTSHGTAVQVKPGPRGVASHKGSPGAPAMPDTLEIALSVRAVREPTRIPTGTASVLRPAHVDGAHRPGTLAPEVDGRKDGEAAGLHARLRGPVVVLLLALAVALTDTLYGRIAETQLMVGPVRPLWIASPLAVFGVAFTLWRLIGYRDDG